MNESTLSVLAWLQQDLVWKSFMQSVDWGVEEITADNTKTEAAYYLSIQLREIIEQNLTNKPPMRLKDATLIRWDSEAIINNLIIDSVKEVNTTQAILYSTGNTKEAEKLPCMGGFAYEGASNFATWAIINSVCNNIHSLRRFKQENKQLGAAGVIELRNFVLQIIMDAVPSKGLQPWFFGLANNLLIAGFNRVNWGEAYNTIVAE